MRQMRVESIKVNRAPVLTLWGAVVAERLGFDRDEALTLGRVARAPSGGGIWRGPSRRRTRHENAGLGTPARGARAQGVRAVRAFPARGPARPAGLGCRRHTGSRSHP